MIAVVNALYGNVPRRFGRWLGGGWLAAFDRWPIPTLVSLPPLLRALSRARCLSGDQAVCKLSVTPPRETNSLRHVAMRVGRHRNLSVRLRICKIVGQFAVRECWYMRPAGSCRCVRTGKGVAMGREKHRHRARACRCAASLGRRDGLQRPEKKECTG